MMSPPCKDIISGLSSDDSPDALLRLLPLDVKVPYLLTSTHSVATHTPRALNESSEQLEGMKEHVLFLIESVISSPIISACQGKASDS